MWLTNEAGESRNWQMYFAAAGLVKTYAAPSWPFLPYISYQVVQNYVDETYALERSMASSILVTECTNRQLSCTFWRSRVDFLRGR